MSRNKTRPGRKRDSETREILDLLHRGLSDEEIQQILVGALAVLDKPGQDRLAARLGKETSRTLRGLLEPRGRKGKTGARARPLVGAAKVRQEWDRAWSDWNSCVGEASDEHGKYIQQEEDWDPPYLDAVALAEDLEPIARRMKKQLARVFEEDLDPAFGFAEAIQDMDQEIASGLPEWMDGLADGCSLGPEATGCLLEWEWRTAQRDSASAFAFADRLCRVESELENVSLNGDTVVSFALDRSPADQATILRGMIEHGPADPWARVLGTVHSAWFTIQNEICRRQDPARYLENCRRSVAQDWRLALPVLDELLDQKAFAAALPVIEEAIRALLHLRAGEAWGPCASLLVHHRGMTFWDRQDAPVDRLLAAWRKVARGAGQEETARSLEIQRIACRRWAAGDAMLAAFEKAFPGPCSQTCEHLFADWRNMIVEVSLGLYGPGREVPERNWLHALVDGARAGKAGAPAFHEAVRRWLETLEHAPAALGKARVAIELLTLEADPGTELRAASRTLAQSLEAGHRHRDRMLRGTRCRWLKVLDAAVLFPELVRFWQRNAVRLLPDPNQDGPSYEACAEWLAVVWELVPQDYERVVQAWAVAHGRKRNLWKAIEKRKLRFGEQRIPTE